MHNVARNSNHTGPLRVLWVVHWYPSSLDTTTGSFHRTQVEALLRAGVSVDVAAPVPWVPPFFDHLHEKWREYTRTIRVETFEGVRIVRPWYLSHPRENLVGYPHIPMRCAINRLRMDPPDLVHAHCAYPPGFVARDLARAWGIPWALTLHGTDVNVYPYVNRMSARRFREMATGADALLAVSSALSERTAELTGVMPETMPVGVNLRPYADLPTRKAARMELELPRDKWIAVFVGRLTAEKGIGELLKALECLEKENVLGVFVGVGEMAKEIQRAPGALLVGKQPNERVPLFIAAADVMILPSYHEGMPTVLVEAGATGTPIIATRIGGIPELLGDDRGYLIEPRSVDAIMEALMVVRGNAYEAKERGSNMQAFIREHYNADRSAERLSQIYYELVARRQAMKHEKGGLSVDAA